MTGFDDAFIGREREAAALSALLHRGERVVTVVGPPGVGKTRLARHVADRWQREEGAALFVDLSEATDAGSIAAALGASLGVAPAHGAQGGDPLLSAAQALAARGPVVVVLDDFERLVRFALVTVQRFRDLTPRAQFLVTSRERLRLPEEVVFELGPLATAGADLDSDAGRLLLDRARRVRADYAPGPGERATLTRIVELLEGLPLALELAAARLDVLDPAALLERLADRFAVLREDRGGHPRSLAGALECSWELLGPVERAALTQCTVFRGGFTVAAAEAVLELPPAGPVLDVVQALRDRSLLRATDAPPPVGRRLGMYASVRELAAARLEPAAARAARDRHLAHYAHVLRTTDPVSPRLIAVEQENLLAAVAHGLDAAATAERARDALELVGALDALPALRLTVDEHLGLLDRAVAAAEAAGPPPALTATLLTSRARARRRAGRNADGAADLQAALALAERAGDRRLQGRVLHGLGRIRLLQDRLDDADVALERALALHRETGDRRYEARTSSTLGFCRLQRDDEPGAREHAERALACVRAHADEPAEAECRYFFALVHHHAGRLSAAREAYAAAERTAEAAGDHWTAAFCRVESGLVLLEEGRLAEARRTLQGAEAGIVGFDPRGEGLLLSHLGAVAALSGDLQDATWLFDRAEQLLQAMDVALLPAVVGPQRGLLDLARARRARAEGDEEGARLLERRAEERLATARRGGRPDGEVSRGASIVNTDLVVVTRILAAALRDRGLGEADGRQARRAAVVDPEGRWFEAPGGARVDCTRRRPLRRILLALARARLDTPGRPVPRAELLEAGWPGERARPDSARNRLNVALHALRKLGLREVLLTSDAGCRLDETVPLRWGT